MADSYAILRASPLAPGGAAEVGNKAWNLMRMAQAGLPVPPAFVLPTDWSARHAPADAVALNAALEGGIAALEAASGLGFGATWRPLLVSVRSGAAVSMPGMMETVLDVGLNAATVEGLIALTGNPRLAWDSYRRLVQGFSEVVAGQPTAPFDALVAAALVAAEVEQEAELDFRSLRGLTRAMLVCYRDLVGSAFPDDPRKQLRAATDAVFRSWNAPKAKSYRRLNGLDGAAGTAVTVQTMVYGNAGGTSGAGVGFTRNPATGERQFYFDFRFDAQGEDVVAGRQAMRDNDRLRQDLPDIWQRLDAMCRELEALFRDAQDFEFTVQDGALFLLQARRAKRTDWAALAIAVDLVEEGLLTPAEGLHLLDGIELEGVARTSFAPPVPATLAVAQVASLGVASGIIALDSNAVKRLTAAGESAIFVRHDTVTSDIEGMAMAAGILTATGGRTSHAAVVARQLGKVCLVGCPTLVIDLALRTCRIGQTTLREGEAISLDGNSGAVFPGTLAALAERPEHMLATIAGWRGEATA
ncbi:PEP/pyruvate-binding domain-containing protein [Falsiroseomonas selenitidurans]|uniref:Pyruvate, phosphate dikinase n=1 Tax=Falsiroseomonas selenitidurans TaxID=2716335 RepID=A0ABX1E8S4_9PROT|nr:PEP/pyruvate-binding domain-containing protein [Falsiroseomonas selenitidurans]NKC33620.1 pyruvate, phosphate dikinase [Falsiroseomonas selenitidurans]